MQATVCYTEFMSSLNDMRVRLIGPSEFPKVLVQIPDPPKKIEIIGEVPSFEKYKYLTIVGSRIQSAYGKRVLEKIISDLQGYDIVIVSGLALGTDSHAHKLAIRYGLKTIAIPGSGLSKKVLYPRTNFSLAMDILKNGGALLSEFDFNQKAAPWTFPKRNRIMAAISDATVVIESKEKSGTLITARLATEYNKDLFVVPGNIFQDSMQGNLQFLKLGAVPLTSGKDILDYFNLYKKDATKSVDTTTLSNEELIILNYLTEPTEKEILHLKTKLDITDFNVAFSKLELKSLIKEETGKVFKT